MFFLRVFNGEEYDSIERVCAHKSLEVGIIVYSFCWKRKLSLLHHEQTTHSPSMTIDNLNTFIFVHGTNVMLNGIEPPIAKLRPEIAIKYCICISHCRSTIMLSVSSVSSSEGHATTVTSFMADNFCANVPGRCANALSLQMTEPKSHVSEGGEPGGIANDMGYV